MAKSGARAPSVGSARQSTQMSIETEGNVEDVNDNGWQRVDSKRVACTTCTASVRIKAGQDPGYASTLNSTCRTPELAALLSIDVRCLQAWSPWCCVFGASGPRALNYFAPVPPSHPLAAQPCLLHFNTLSSPASSHSCHRNSAQSRVQASLRLAGAPSSF